MADCKHGPKFPGQTTRGDLIGSTCECPLTLHLGPRCVIKAELPAPTNDSTIPETRALPLRSYCHPRSNTELAVQHTTSDGVHFHPDTPYNRGPRRFAGHIPCCARVPACLDNTTGSSHDEDRRFSIATGISDSYQARQSERSLDGGRFQIH